MIYLRGSGDLIRADQGRLLCLMALRRIGRGTAGVDDGHEERTGDGGYLVGPGA